MLEREAEAAIPAPHKKMKGVCDCVREEVTTKKDRFKLMGKK